VIQIEVEPIDRRRPQSYHRRHGGERVWPLIQDYRLDLKHVPHLSAALRDARKARGLTQKQVAELVSEEPIEPAHNWRRLRREARMANRRRLTCSLSMFIKLERGERAPSVRMAERLIEVLQLSPVVAQLLLAESVVPRGADAYKKPWQRPAGYEPPASRRLGIQGATDPPAAGRQPGPDLSQLRLQIVPLRTFANFRPRL